MKLLIMQRPVKFFIIYFDEELGMSNKNCFDNVWPFQARRSSSLVTFSLLMFINILSLLRRFFCKIHNRIFSVLQMNFIVFSVHDMNIRRSVLPSRFVEYRQSSLISE
jgi:hypothetical protein